MHLPPAAEVGLAHGADGLQPAEDRFDAMADALAEAVPDVARGAAVDRTAAAAVNAERRCPQFSDLICPLFIG